MFTKTRDRYQSTDERRPPSFLWYKRSVIEWSNMLPLVKNLHDALTARRVQKAWKLTKTVMLGLDQWVMSRFVIWLNLSGNAWRPRSKNEKQLEKFPDYSVEGHMKVILGQPVVLNFLALLDRFSPIFFVSFTRKPEFKYSVISFTYTQKEKETWMLNYASSVDSKPLSTFKTIM